MSTAMQLPKTAKDLLLEEPLLKEFGDEYLHGVPLHVLAIRVRGALGTELADDFVAAFGGAVDGAPLSLPPPLLSTPPRSNRRVITPERPQPGKRQGYDSPPASAARVAGPTAAQLAEYASKMPTLAGAPLEAPNLFETNWRVGQRFTSRDDPDRTREAWQCPQFGLSKDPVAQSQLTKVEELEIARSYDPKQRFARVVRNVLEPEDSAALIARVNAKGFTPALLNVGRDLQELAPTVRDGHRVIVDSPELVAWLLEVLRPHLPAELPNGLRLAGLNERCRFLCYTPGQMFEEHLDGCYRRPPGHPQEGDRSFITVQLYLHDVPTENGGATTFFPGRSCSVAHQPEAGSVLLFTQDLEHEGSLVKAGLKYTLRTEVMYTSRKENIMPDVVMNSAA